MYDASLRADGLSGITRNRRIAMNRTILVPIDYSDVTDTLLEEACQLAGALDATLHLVHAATIGPVVYSAYQAGMGTAYPRKTKIEMLEEAAEHLGRVAETCRPNVQTVTTSLLEGNAGPAIMEEARRVSPMMIVLGSHGHGALHHLLAGSVCEHVMKHAVCPITVVPSRIGTYKTDIEATPAARTL
jgi:nucleotide-binding universal stress UspA family protein